MEKLSWLFQIGWVSGAFLVGILLGVCIGFTIGSIPPPECDRARR